MAAAKGKKKYAEKLNEYPRQGNEEPRIDLVGNMTDAAAGQERLVKGDDDDVLHLENMKNVQGSNKDARHRK